MNCNDISLAGCRNNAIVHDPTLKGKGTGNDPLGVNIDALQGLIEVVTEGAIEGNGTPAQPIKLVDGTAVGQVEKWNGTDWVREKINVSEIETDCSNNSLLYAAGGELACTLPELTFDGANLGGTGGIDMVGANGSLKYDPSNAEINIEVDNGNINKKIYTNNTDVVLFVEKDTNNLNIGNIQLISKDAQLNNRQCDLLVSSEIIRNAITNTSNGNTYTFIDLQSNRRITEIYQNKYQYFSPSTGLSGLLTAQLTGNYELRDKDTLTGNGIATALYAFPLPNTAATARVTGSLIARRSTATNSASSTINLHANWLSSNNWQLTDVGGGAMYDDIGCTISITYNNISNTLEAKIQLPNDGNQYVIFTNLEIQLLAL